MKKNTVTNKISLLIFVLIGALSCSKAYCLTDSTKSKRVKNIDFRTERPVGLYFNRLEGYTPFFYEDMVFNLNNSYRSKTVPLFYIKLNCG